MSVVPLGALGARARRAAAPATVAEAATPSSLACLAPGDHAVVSEIDEAAGPAVARRLHDLGFAPGAVVQVLRRAPLADPVVYRVAGYDIALRRAQAGCIRVAHAS